MNHLSRAGLANASPERPTLASEWKMETGWNVLTHDFDSHEANAENACDD